MARDNGSFGRTGAGRQGLSADAVIPAQFARTELAAGPSPPARTGAGAEFDRMLVRESFSRMLASSDEAMEYLFARLFAERGEIRALFPLGMAQTRDAVKVSLTRLMAGLDDRAETERLLGQIARDHRKYGVREQHYAPFFAALVANVREAAGAGWSEPAELAWQAATRYFAAVMKEAADRDARTQPAWWVGEVAQHELRTPTVAVLTIRPDRPLGYQPGQYVWLQTPRWPRVWRRYSIANFPHENGLLDIHVRAVPGGLVSSTLVGHCSAGDTVILSAARGDFLLPSDPDRNIVCVAGGTGLAPAKAIIGAVISAVRPGRRRAITLYLGARTAADLYDMRDLETLRNAYPPFTLVPVTEDGSGTRAVTGRLPEVVRRHESFRDTDVYVSGPAGLVSATVRALTGRVAPERLHYDPLDALEAASRYRAGPGSRGPEPGSPESGGAEPGGPARG